MNAQAPVLDFARPALVPAPAHLSWKPDVAVALGPETRFVVACPDPAAADWARSHLEAWFGFASRVEASREAPAAAKGDEGYALRAEPGLVVLGARTLLGAKWAAHALRQAATRAPSWWGEHSVRAAWWLPALEVEDAPALPFRGLHLCCFPETSLLWIERMVRLAASYRFNHVVLEPWGTFRAGRHPELSWPDAPLDAAVARRLAALASDLGTTLVPQFNALGHASGSRWRSGKHAALDFHPELEPLFEPDGWNWCLSNPDAAALVRDVVEEQHDAFGSPPFFHLGFDEAQPPTCPVCRAARPSWEALAAAHLRSLRDLLAARGARAMVWQDMLLARGDQRWKGFVANARSPEAAETLLGALPRDVVVCDWFYGPPAPSYPTLDRFRDLGFDTLSCTWDDLGGIDAQARHARDAGLFGLLHTTWHHVRGDAFALRVERAAHAAWGAEPPGGSVGLPFLATHWRRAGRDAGVSRYEDAGFSDLQTPPALD